MEAERQWGPSSVSQQGLRSLVPDCTFLGIPITSPSPTCWALSKMIHTFLTSWLLFAGFSDWNQGVAPSLLHITVALKLALTLPEATFISARGSSAYCSLVGLSQPRFLLKMRCKDSYLFPCRTTQAGPWTWRDLGWVGERTFGALTVLATALLPSILQMSRCSLSYGPIPVSEPV